ncbi:hypothetical protein [Lentimicrobium sp. S6]|uniref:hypothetical protein n=1 Tax=Lentimicrobium sp. S6 TaxID=2735872 RepID=UPI001554C0BC|nr:hypothetical protein [Lentimicrobium sp. S6]NPD48067.1 hypothetical protein [Lentimicrobium sp. S6]
MNQSLIPDDLKFRIISEDRKYWFLRTYSGDLFNEFFHEDYVGIGLNNIPIDLIKNAHQVTLKKEKEERTGFLTLRKYIENNSSYEGGECTKWANQVVSFYHEIKPGDIIIIPSKNSFELAIGEVLQDMYVVDDDRHFIFKETHEPYPQKRRKVNWLLKKRRSKFEGDLARIFNGRAAVTNIDYLQEAIESHISSLFLIGDIGHVVIRIKQDQSINAFQFNKFLSSLTYFYHEVCKENGVEINEDLFIKIKVQSKGKMALSGTFKVGILSLAFIFAFSDNPTLELDLGEYEFKASGDGPFQTLTNFLNASQERKIKMIELIDARKSIMADTTIDNDLPNNELIDQNDLNNNAAENIEENGIGEQ